MGGGVDVLIVSSLSEVLVNRSLVVSFAVRPPVLGRDRSNSAGQLLISILLILQLHTPKTPSATEFRFLFRTDPGTMRSEEGTAAATLLSFVRMLVERDVVLPIYFEFVRWVIEAGLSSLFIRDGSFGRKLTKIIVRMCGLARRGRPSRRLAQRARHTAARARNLPTSARVPIPRTGLS